MVSQVMRLPELEFGKEGAFQRIFTCCETSPDVSQEKPQYCIHTLEAGPHSCRSLSGPCFGKRKQNFPQVTRDCYSYNHKVGSFSCITRQDPECSPFSLRRGTDHCSATGAGRVSEDGRGSKILSELSRQVPGRQLCCRRPVWPQQPQPSFAGFYSLCPIFSHSEHTHPCTNILTQAGTWPLEASPQLRRGNRGWCGRKDHLPETADVRIPASPLVSSALNLRPTFFSFKNEGNIIYSRLFF